MYVLQKTITFISLDIKYLVFGLYSIEYRSKRICKSQILFYLFYTVSQLFRMGVVLTIIFIGTQQWIPIFELQLLHSITFTSYVPRKLWKQSCQFCCFSHCSGCLTDSSQISDVGASFCPARKSFQSSCCLQLSISIVTETKKSKRNSELWWIYCRGHVLNPVCQVHLYFYSKLWVRI